MFIFVTMKSFYTCQFYEITHTTISIHPNPDLLAWKLLCVFFMISQYYCNKMHFHSNCKCWRRTWLFDCLTVCWFQWMIAWCDVRTGACLGNLALACSTLMSCRSTISKLPLGAFLLACVCLCWRHVSGKLSKICCNCACFVFVGPLMVISPSLLRLGTRHLTMKRTRLWVDK